MVPTPPPLPTRFPCWCRAVYSWGGESSQDLGFVEGDLIECLNAGDGSWWTGRLRRNKTVGVFPSNFVEVLPDDFRPISRSISPLAPANAPSPTTSLQKTKSKPFRKPFEAYAKAPHYTTAKQPEIIRQPSNAPPRKNSTASFRTSRDRIGHGPPTPAKHRDYVPRAPTPAPFDSSYRAKAPSQASSPGPPHISAYNQRARSPAPPINSYHRRTPSPAPPHMSRQNSIVSSPAPQHVPSYHHRAPSPVPPPLNPYGSRAPSPAPPPPPNHYGSRTSSPAPPPLNHYGSRAPSPVPPPLNHYGSRAPSPVPPPLNHYGSRAPSPVPPPLNHYGSRAPSPAPPPLNHYGSRALSPAPPPTQSHGARTPSPSPSFSFKPYRPGAECDSPPPPAPPPHRNLLTRGNSTVSYDDRSRSQGYHTPRAASPAPPSPTGVGFTPSPIREAMDGVIEQLDALGVPRHSGSPEPSFDPWSPESFDLVNHRSRRKMISSQLLSGPAHQDSGYESYSNDSQDNSAHHGYREEYALPHLENYMDRMDTRLRRMQQHHSSLGALRYDADPAPPPPLKSHQMNRSKSSVGDDPRPLRSLHKQLSSYDVGFLDRTATIKTNSTIASTGNRSSTTMASTNTQSTHRSLMSGTSAGGMSATSAGSLARKNNRARSAVGYRDGDEDWDPNRPTTPFTGVSYHPSHSTSALRHGTRTESSIEGIAAVGGLVEPGEAKPRRPNFIKRILEVTKTSVASSRNSMTTGISTGSLQSSPLKRPGPDGVTAIAGGLSMPSLERGSARDSGYSCGVDWVQVRQDVNRSNTLSKNERNERRDRCQMMDYPAIDPVDELYENVEGDEDGDGHPVLEPTNYQALNLSQVDKNSRFVNNLPPMTTAVTLATNYVCRPYRSDVQRLRAIFAWIAENILWEEDYEAHVDTRRVIQTRRACAEEYSVLVHEMCAAVGIQSEIVRGYLRTPGEVLETSIRPRSNHWWNAVLVDNEWRMMDCCLASPSNPNRALYSNAGSATPEFWWFLARPTEICWTHIPEHHMQQHICPPVAPEILLNLPGACPAYFKNSIVMVDYNTSLTRIEDLEMLHIKFNVPADVEVAAEVEVRAYSRDSDGDLFETGDVIKKRALAQAEWYNGVKRYTVKALLPGDEGTGVLKVYAGKRGLMHSIKDIPHPLAFAIPIIHTGDNPPYEFVTRHPTPHAQRHDIYVAQPQCQRLALNNTFVFAIRQHPSSIGNNSTPSNPGSASPIPFARPASATSMASSAAASAPSSATGSIAGKKPAKLAIQTPGGKILRLMRKEERRGFGVGGRHFSSEDEVSDGGTWETIIKCSERGLWRGLVLADRTARWCVFAEWVCVG